MRTKIFLWLLKFSARSLYKYIDKDKDNKISISEIKDVITQLKSIGKLKNDKS